MFRCGKLISSENRQYLGRSIFILNGVIFIFSIIVVLYFCFVMFKLPIHTEYSLLQITMLVGIWLLVLHGVGMKMWLDISQWRTRNRFLRIANLWIVMLVLTSVLTLVMGLLLLTQQTKVMHTIMESVRTSMEKYSINVPAKFVIDTLQTRFRCCGTNSMDDWLQTNWIGVLQLDKEQRYMKNIGFYSNAVPYSCCNPEVHRPCITDQVASLSAHRSGWNQLTIYTRGCQEAIEEYIVLIFTFSGIGMLISWILQMVVIVKARYLYTSVVALRHLGHDAPTCGYFFDGNELSSVLKFKLPTSETDLTFKNKPLRTNKLHRERSGCATCILNSKRYREDQAFSSCLSIGSAANKGINYSDHCLETKENIHETKKFQQSVNLATNGTLQPARVKRSCSISEGLLQTCPNQASTNNHHGSHSCVQIRASQDVTVSEISKKEDPFTNHLPFCKLHANSVGNVPSNSCIHFRGTKASSHNVTQQPESSCCQYGHDNLPNTCYKLSEKFETCRNLNTFSTSERLKPSNDLPGHFTSIKKPMTTKVSSEVKENRKPSKETGVRSSDDKYMESIKTRRGSLINYDENNIHLPTQDFRSNATQTIFHDPCHVWRENTVQSKTSDIPHHSKCKMTEEQSNKTMQDYYQQHASTSCKGVQTIQKELQMEETALKTKNTEYDCNFPADGSREPTGCLSQESHEVWRITQSISQKNQSSVAPHASGVNISSQELFLYDKQRPPRPLCNDHITDHSTNRIPGTKNWFFENADRQHTEGESIFHDQVTEDSVLTETTAGKEKTKRLSYKSNINCQTTDRSKMNNQDATPKAQLQTVEMFTKSCRATEECALDRNKKLLCVGTDLKPKDKFCISGNYSINEEMDAETIKALSVPNPADIDVCDINSCCKGLKSGNDFEKSERRMQPPSPKNEGPRSAKPVDRSKRLFHEEKYASTDCLQTMPTSNCSVVAAGKKRLSAGSEMCRPKSDLPKWCMGTTKQHSELNSIPHAGNLRPLQCKK